MTKNEKSPYRLHEDFIYERMSKVKQLLIWLVTSVFLLGLSPASYGEAPKL